MLRALAEVSVAIARRVTPNPFAFALLLTFVVAFAGLALTDSGPLDMASYWYRGFWDLLTFSMQMVIILVGGHVLATSPPARALIARISSIPRTPSQAILMIAGVACISAFFNWGIGLILGAVLAVTVSASARSRGIKVHFPLAAAAGYTGILVFGNGFSSSAPLLSNTEGHFLSSQIGIVPLEATILTSYNLITLLIFLLTIPLLLAALHPSAERSLEVEPGLVAAFEPEDTSIRVPASESESLPQKLERSPALSLPLAAVGATLVLWMLFTGRAALDLNSLNFLLVMTGMLLYRNPVAFGRAVERAVHTSAGVILQFPFYAGIMGMMTLSGLVGVLAGALIAISTPATLGLTSMISAAIVNLFVPSAGGQWAVQGPILVEAARVLEVPIGQIIMAYAYGDQLTNMVQPFWALPLLGITALEPRDVLGYTAVAMIASFFIFAFGVSVLPGLLGY